MLECTKQMSRNAQNSSDPVTLQLRFVWKASNDIYAVYKRTVTETSDRTQPKQIQGAGLL